LQPQRGSDEPVEPIMTSWLRLIVWVPLIVGACSHQSPRECQSGCPSAPVSTTTCEGPVLEISTLVAEVNLDRHRVRLQGALSYASSWCDLASATTRCCGDGRGEMMLLDNIRASDRVYLRGIRCGARGDGEGCCPLPPDRAVRSFSGTLVNNDGIWSLEDPQLCVDAPQ
jgi:hypothetical protein